MPSEVCRCDETSNGIVISKKGFDVFTAALENLPFNTTRKQIMMVGAGTVYLPSDGSQVFTYFNQTCIAIPMVFCGFLASGGFTENDDTNIYSPVNATPYLTNGVYTGFFAAPRGVGYSDGTTRYPAAGRTVSWFGLVFKE